MRYYIAWDGAVGVPRAQITNILLAQNEIFKMS